MTDEKLQGFSNIAENVESIQHDWTTRQVGPFVNYLSEGGPLLTGGIDPSFGGSLSPWFHH